MIGKPIVGDGRIPLGWNNRILEYGLHNAELPKYLIPHPIDGGVYFPHRRWISTYMRKKIKFFLSVPYYGNERYKKYVEENNGECPLPFPKSVFTSNSVDEKTKDLKLE